MWINMFSKLSDKWRVSEKTGHYKKNGNSEIEKYNIG